ncbi:TPA: sortase B protein-sorting domain-containing protein [Candidatus Galligastranaerophilus faecipullorum]|nr:sortase B protein-sorting domain-containing protein [Candidatus Galligastranaerophilus faecipullorum]
MTAEENAKTSDSASITLFIFLYLLKHIYHFNP